MNQTLSNILSFKGEFPNQILGPLRATAEILAPYDECAHDAEDGDALTLFELLEIQNVFNDSFLDIVLRGSTDICRFIHQKSHGGGEDRIRFLKRFNRALARIRTELQHHGYMLVSWMLSEMLGANDHFIRRAEVTRHGVALAKTRLAAANKVMQTREMTARISRMGFGWYELAERATRSPVKQPLRATGMDVARQTLRTVEVDMDEHRSLILPYQPEATLDLPYVFCLSGSSHPLSIARVHAYDRDTMALCMSGEVARRDGKITFYGCAFITVHSVFAEMRVLTIYHHLRDVITYNLFTLLTTGVIKEKSYIADLSSDDEDVIEDEDTEDELEEEAELIMLPESGLEPAPAPPATIEPEAPSVQANKTVGLGKLSYSNILAKLMQLGVRVGRKGKHVKLRLNQKKASFLNRHKQEDPRHNKRVLRQALKKLGIDELHFWTLLRG